MASAAFSAGDMEASTASHAGPGDTGHGMVPLADLPRLLQEAEQQNQEDCKEWLRILEEVSGDLVAFATALTLK